jgi:single-strand DNA-binding protein
MINTANLLGRVGKKDTRQTKNGSMMTTISLATSKRYKDGQGVNQTLTTWHPINFFSKLSELVEQYTNVGDLIYVTGEINLNRDKDDKLFYSVHAQDVKFVSKGNNEKKVDYKKPAQQETFDDIPF